MGRAPAPWFADRRALVWLALAAASFAWGVAALRGLHAPWLSHAEPSWHWWVQGAFFLGVGVGRISARAANSQEQTDG